MQVSVSDHTLLTCIFTQSLAWTCCCHLQSIAGCSCSVDGGLHGCLLAYLVCQASRQLYGAVSSSDAQSSLGMRASVMYLTSKLLQRLYNLTQGMWVNVQFLAYLACQVSRQLHDNSAVNILLPCLPLVFLSGQQCTVNRTAE